MYIILCIYECNFLIDNIYFLQIFIYNSMYILNIMIKIYIKIKIIFSYTYISILLFKK